MAYIDISKVSKVYNDFMDFEKSLRKNQKGEGKKLKSQC